MNDSLMLSQLITARRTPALAAQMIHAMESARMVRVNKARSTRNFFLRIMSRPVAPAAAPTTISVRTPALAYDYIILAISGGIAASPGNATIDLRFRFDTASRRDLSNENLPGQVLIGGGDFWNLGLTQQDEPMDLPVPIPMREGEQAIIDFIVGTPLANAVTAELTMHCLRVFPAESIPAQLPYEWGRAAERQIRSYLPRMVYLRTVVDYNAIPPDGRFKTDFVKVPMLLLGATSSLVASRLELRDEMDGYEFMPAVGDVGFNKPETKAVPSWVIAPNKNHNKGAVYWFQRPHLLVPGTRLLTAATDGLDLQDPPINEAMFGVPAQPKKITWICQTV